MGYKIGLHNVGSYQVSGKPYATGSIDCRTGTNGVAKITFPSVTSWVTISNLDSAAQHLLVGFSENGVLGTEDNYFLEIPHTSGSGPVRLDLKLSALYLSGSDECSVVAGLTFIHTDAINNASISPSGSNWSGSVGI
jgi:hypothetical protein|tara:strand:- start:26 stop:436 length:411 start_codon:yes stop_codon:yes gene_type:complete